MIHSSISIIYRITETYVSFEDKPHTHRIEISLKQVYSYFEAIWRMWRSMAMIKIL